MQIIPKIFIIFYLGFISNNIEYSAYADSSMAKLESNTKQLPKSISLLDPVSKIIKLKYERRYKDEFELENRIKRNTQTKPETYSKAKFSKQSVNTNMKRTITTTAPAEDIIVHDAKVNRNYLLADLIRKYPIIGLLNALQPEQRLHYIQTLARYYSYHYSGNKSFKLRLFAFKILIEYHFL